MKTINIENDLSDKQLKRLENLANAMQDFDDIKNENPYYDIDLSKEIDEATGKNQTQTPDNSFVSQDLLDEMAELINEGCRNG